MHQWDHFDTLRAEWEAERDAQRHHAQRDDLLMAANALGLINMAVWLVWLGSGAPGLPWPALITVGSLIEVGRRWRALRAARPASPAAGAARDAVADPAAEAPGGTPDAAPGSARTPTPAPPPANPVTGARPADSSARARSGARPHRPAR